MTERQKGPGTGYQSGIVCNPTFLLRRGGLNLLSTFQKGVSGKEGVTFLRGLQFLHKDNSKSEMFSNKKSFLSKFFFL